MKRFLRAATAALVTCSGAVVFTAAGVSVAPIASANAPGSPGTPSAPTVVFQDLFDNNPQSTDISVGNYTGAGPVAMTYTADGPPGANGPGGQPATGWLNAGCNGMVLSASTTNSGTAGCGATEYSNVQAMAQALGAYRGLTPAQAANSFAVGAYTQGDPAAPNTSPIELATTKSIPVTANRFLVFAVDMAEENCYSNHAQMYFYLKDGSTEIPTNTSAVDPCGSNTTNTTTPVVGTSESTQGVLYSGTSVGFVMRNAQDSGAGNDVAFGNVRILDATPQLDQSFASPSVVEGANNVLTYTITNTTDLAEKNGWGFSETLPSGLTVTGTPTTTCAAADLSGITTGGSSIAVTGGDLAAGASSCTVSVPVAASAEGTYTIPGSAATLTGLDAPASAQMVSGPTSCGYGVGGTEADLTCWIDFSGYNPVLAAQPGGQPMSLNVGGNTATFTITQTGTAGSQTSPGPALATPWYPNQHLGGAGAPYQNIPGEPILASEYASSLKYTISNFKMTDPQGNPVTDYALAVADAEATNAQESFTFGSDKPLNPYDPQSASNSYCSGAFSGAGTTSVSCTGGAPAAGQPYGGVILQANSATTIDAAPVGDPNAGVGFAIVHARVTLDKSFATKANASDSVDLAATAQGYPTATASTGGAMTASASQPFVWGGPVNLSESATSGTNDFAAYAQAWNCTNASTVNGTNTVLPAAGATGTSQTINPLPGDDITCTLTNTFADSFHLVGGQTTPINTPVTSPIGHLAGDNGASPLDPTSTTVTTQGANGTVSIDPTSGAVTYTPNPGFAGTDSYVINVCDKAVPTEQCGDVTVPVTVTNVVANPDSSTTTVGTPVNTDVRANDTTSSGTPLQDPTVATQPSNGTASVNADGTIKYTPNAGFSGTDSYTYQVCDSATPTQSCAIGKVTVTVDNVFTPGAASTSGVTTPQNQAVTTPLSSIASTSGKPLDPTGVSQVTAPAHGSISIDPTTGAVTYTPTPGYSGPDSYVVTVCDTSTPSQCSDVTVPVTVGVNTVKANDDTDSTSVGTPVTTDVEANDTSASGQALANPTVASQPSNGTATVSGNKITYTPNAGFSGQDSYTYQVCDTSTPTPVCSTATVTVTVDNVFNGGTATTTGVSTPQNQPTTTPLSSIASTTGEPLDPTKVTSVTAPSHGSISIDPTTGAVTYTPTPGYSGPDSYTVNVCDTSSPVQCTNETVPVTVGTNTVTANDDAVTANAGSSVSTDVRANDTSASGQALANPTVTSAPSHGTATVNANGTITYTPTAGYSGPDSYEYNVCDTSTPTPVCSTATVNITVKNVFTGSSVTTGQNKSVTTPLSGLVKVTGEPVDPTKVTKVSGPSHGKITINPTTGAVTYTPNKGYSGSDTYVLKVCDTSTPVQCSNVTEHVTVTPNKVTGGSAPAAVSTKAGTPVSINPVAGVKSASGQPLGKAFISAKPKHGSAKVNANGTITYTPAKGFSGTDSFKYTICDTGRPQACLTRTLTVTVKAAAIVVPGLPDTGGPSLDWWLGGGAALLAGFALMIAGRRRKA